MSTENCAGVESTGTADVDPARVEILGVIGVDAQGCKHKYDRVRDQVVVQEHRDGSIEHVEVLGDRDVDEWVRFVRFCRGWVDVWFGEDLGTVDATERLQQALIDAGVEGSG